MRKQAGSGLFVEYVKRLEETSVNPLTPKS